MPELTEQQERAVKSIDHHVLVSAGAGSGKTLVLVERYIEVLEKHQDASISDLVAVTFTRKAAEEMRNRLKGRLKEIMDSAKTEEMERWSKFLADVDHARIGTIHSLCDSILKAFPAEAGVDPQFELLDDLSRAELLEASVDEILQEAINSRSNDYESLLEYPIEQIKGWILPQLESAPQYREARAALGSTSRQALTAFAEQLIASVKNPALEAIANDPQLGACALYLTQNPWHDEGNTLEDRRREALSLIETIMGTKEDAPAEPQALDVREDCLRRLAGLKAGNFGGARGKPLRAVLKRAREIASDVISPFPEQLRPVDNEAFCLIKEIISLADSALSRYETLKRRSQKVDFNDLIELADNLLSSPHSAARRHFNERLRAILVDEFQDTNRTQARLVASLCGEHGRLFLIGDDKQSIYRFQGADVGTFNEWKHILQKCEPAASREPADCDSRLQGAALLLDLSYSFRSHPSIVAFVNCLFRNFFETGDGGPEYRARHQALSPSREDESDPNRVEILIFDPREDQEEKRQAQKARLFESETIAAWIAGKVAERAPVYDKEKKENRPITWGDFAILVQSNSDFAQIESVLSDRQIPYVTLAGTGFLDRQEILDIESILRFLSCPLDDHALLAVLRAPFFSISDDIIHRLHAGQNRRLWSEVQAAARQGSQPALEGAVESLKYLMAAAARENLGSLLRTIILTTSLDVILEALPDGKQRSRNVWKLAAMAQEHNHLTPSEFVQALACMRKLGVTNQSEAPLNAEDSVKLMTIHKSKGLEFPAVVLPVMGRSVHRNPGKLLVHKDFGLCFDPTRQPEDEKPAFFQISAHLARQMEDAEKKRLLYVAMTRARDYLGIFLERQVQNRESFRLWLLTALTPDPEEEFPDSGIRSLVRGEESASYLVSNIDRQALCQWQQRTSLSGMLPLPAGLDPCLPGLALIESLTPAKAETPAFPVPWQELCRITPSAESPAPHQTVVGSYFHALMQRLAANLESPSLGTLRDLTLSNEIKAFHGQFADYLVAEGQRLIDIFFESDLFYKLCSARRRLAEVPYTIISPQGLPLERRCDLIVEDGSGSWHIIDFKTDQLRPAEIEKKVAEHSEQLSEYVRHFKEITGTQARAWLYFAQLGRLCEVELPVLV